MIDESVVCLDRRVVNPPAGEAGGATTWTLPYPVAVDGSQGTVAVVRLDTGVRIDNVTRPTTTTASAPGSFSGVPVAVGITYRWSYTPSAIYYRDPSSGRPDRRAATVVAYVRAYFNDTRHIAATVTVPDSVNCTVSLDEVAPSEGQTLTVPVCSDGKIAALEFSTEEPWPVCLGMMEWEGVFSPQSAAQIP